MPILFTESELHLADAVSIKICLAQRSGPPWDPRALPDLGLSEEDLERVSHFRDPLVASQYIASHLLLNRALLAVLGTDFTPGMIKREPKGKPFLPGNPVRFSLSRSGDFSAVAISPSVGIGIDLETRLDLSAAREVASRVLGPEELIAWRALKTPFQLEDFRARWCLKEAVLKVSGEGLSRDPRDIALEVNPPQYRLTRFPAEYGPVDKWELGCARLAREVPPLYWAARSR